MFKENKKYLIKTPTGFENFMGINKKIVNTLYRISFEDDTFIRCTDNHRLLAESGFVFAKNVKKKQNISGKIVKSIFVESGIFSVFDPIAVDKHETYFSNDIVSHNCEFLGSSNTLIKGSTLAKIPFIDPIKETAGVMIYEEPIPGKSYTLIADTSRSVGLDYCAFVVVDISQVPYKVVATFRDNTIPVLTYPTLIHNVATYYNEALVCVEINDNGQQVVDDLWNDLEYENIMTSKTSGRAGTSIGGEYDGQVRRGLRTTQQVKRIGCFNLKAIIENEQLIINDFNILQELHTFTLKGNSYEADTGYNDDLVMCLVLFAWMANQKYFREFTDTDAKQKMLLDNEKMLLDKMTPFGFVMSGDGIDAMHGLSEKEQEEAELIGDFISNYDHKLL